MTEQEKQALRQEKKRLEAEIARIRKKRYTGMDDDVAEDIMEELYRNLLEIEKSLTEL